MEQFDWSLLQNHAGAALVSLTANGGYSAIARIRGGPAARRE